MTLAKASDSGLGHVVLKIMNLADIMSSSWHGNRQNVGMNLVLIMAKISATQFSMAIDDLDDDRYRFSLFPHGEC